MKKINLLLLIICLLQFSSCNLSYGKKVKINDSLEVYIKGDSVTEDDGRKLGNYLAELWKDAHNEKSLQLTKESGAYIVRMVVDEKMVKQDTSLNASFEAVKSLLETEVFKTDKIKFIITDNQFNDIKSF